MKLFFFETQGRFFLRLEMRLELSHGTTIAAVIGHTVVDLKMKGQMRARPRRLSLPWQRVNLD